MGAAAFVCGLYQFLAAVPRWVSQGRNQGCTGEGHWQHLHREVRGGKYMSPSWNRAAKLWIDSIWHLRAIPTP